MNKFFISVILAGMLLVGCGSDQCCEGEKLVQSKAVSGEVADVKNETPIAVITNLPTKIYDCSNITASAESSYDTDGSVEEYIWSVSDLNISSNKNLDEVLSCENNQSEFEVCLNVIDNNGALSIPTCQIVQISEDERVEQSSEKILVPIIKIPEPKRVEKQYIFDVCDQTFDGFDVDSYHWQVTKHFKDGSTATHTRDTCKKYLYAYQDFEKLDITLTITFTDGNSTIATNSYVKSNDGEKLN